MSNRRPSGKMAPPGERSYPPPCTVHDVGRNPRTGVKQCKDCGLPLQTLVDDGRRALIEGEYRAVCEGPRCVCAEVAAWLSPYPEADTFAFRGCACGGDADETCSIGPGDPHPMLEWALDDLHAHNARALAEDGRPHATKVIQL